MKTAQFENIVTDEVHDRTFVVMAHRQLTDGEVYSVIRVALLRRGERHPKRGERLVITSSVK